FQIRAACAPFAARFSVAAVDGGCSARGIGSSWGPVDSCVHLTSWILWCAMPASLLPSGTCILSSNSSSQRASSRRSGTPFLFSGIAILPSAKSPADVPSACVRSHQLSNVHTEMPALTTYLPWSPASYQPPDTSSVYVQPAPGAHGTDVSPMFGLTSM